MGTIVAIKKFNNEDVKSYKAFLVEIDVNLAIRGHPNIIQFIGAFSQGKFSYVVTELGIKGNLFDFIIKNK